MALAPHDNLGKHKLRSIEDIPEAPGNPQLYLSSAKTWTKPSDTTNFLSFQAAVNIAAGQAVSLRDDGLVELATSALLSQRGSYAGVATNNTMAGDTVYTQMVGLQTGPWAFTPGNPVFIGINGELTQLVPVEGYRQCIGTSFSADTVLLSPRKYVVCLASSDAIPRPGGSGGGTEEIRWATVQEVKDGTLPFAAISPQTLHPYINDVIAQYGLTPSRIATVDDIRAGTPDKVVMSQYLKPILDELTGGTLDFATTADIRAGTSGTKIMNPQAWYPIYQELQNAAANIEYATAADIEAGISSTKVISPQAYKTILNRLDAKDAELEAAIPAAATLAEVEAGIRNDVYLSPAVAKTVLDDIRDDIPVFATLVDFTNNSTTTVVAPADINRIIAATEAKIPAAASEAEVAAGVSENTYVNPKELHTVVTGLGIPAINNAITDLTNRLTTLEDEFANYEPIVWATEEEVIAGLVEHKAVDPKRLQAKIDDLNLEEGVFATVDQAREGVLANASINPATLAIVLREQTAALLDEFGAVYPGTEQ